MYSLKILHYTHLAHSLTLISNSYRWAQDFGSDAMKILTHVAHLASSQFSFSLKCCINNNKQDYKFPFLKLNILFWENNVKSILYTYLWYYVYFSFTTIKRTLLKQILWFLGEILNTYYHHI